MPRRSVGATISKRVVIVVLAIVCVCVVAGILLIYPGMSATRPSDLVAPLRWSNAATYIGVKETTSGVTCLSLSNGQTYRLIGVSQYLSAIPDGSEMHIFGVLVTPSASPTFNGDLYVQSFTSP